MNDHEMARLAHSSLALVLEATARRSGGTAIDERGLLLVAGVHPCPIFVNSAMRTDGVDAAESIARADAFFKARSHGFEFWAVEGMDADIEKAALAAGMRVCIEMPGMVSAAPPDLPPQPRGVEVRWAKEGGLAKAFVDVVAKGFFDPEWPDLPDLWRATLSAPGFLTAPDLAACVVLDQGNPVAAAATVVLGSVAWIGWVATLPEARGRGFGRLATAAATREGFRLGGTFACLEAMPMGVSVYERLGFREVLRYRTYWPAWVRG